MSLGEAQARREESGPRTTEALTGVDAGAGLLGNSPDWTGTSNFGWRSAENTS